MNSNSTCGVGHAASNAGPQVRKPGNFGFGLYDFDHVMNECGYGKDNLKPLKSCQGCCRVRYCSKECQKAAWKSHKRECKEVQNEARRATIPNKPFFPKFYSFFYELVFNFTTQLKSNTQPTKVQ